MKTNHLLWFIAVGFMVLIFSSCSKEEEPNPIECEVSYNLPATDFVIGEHLVINTIEITPVVPPSGVKVKKVAFFLGNRNIGTCPAPPYELDYEIPELPEGEHLLQIDVHLTADGYDDTTIWIKQNIRINKNRITE